MPVAKPSCQMLAAMLAPYGVRRVVLSPGSRNAPLVMAIERSGQYDTRVVIDERSAAFIALGMASTTGEPVALVCTSGSALLNYAPAVAEAYYRRIPLIVISADRPAEWIDQDDSQTIHQPGALGNFTKYSCTISDFSAAYHGGDRGSSWHPNRKINDALSAALSQPRGPVHINVELDEPLTAEVGADSYDGTLSRIIRSIAPQEQLTADDVKKLGVAQSRTMIVAGFMPPDPVLDAALARLVARGVVLLTEAQSNIHVDGAIDRIDTTLRAIDGDSSLAPDCVITIGGAILSRHVKGFLRKSAGVRHYHVGHYPQAIDCFKHLSATIAVDPLTFLTALANVLEAEEEYADTAYSQQWHALGEKAAAAHDAFCRVLPWSDFQAMRLLMRHLPRNINLHLSNGTAVRYAQLMPHAGFHRVECNRGVSGIEGSTSTAIGAALADDERPTVLVTGDMSAQYDMGALATNDIPARFYMIVLNNGGGGIFRFIRSTGHLPELERNFVAQTNLPLQYLAAGFGFRYLEATDEMTLIDAIAAMAQPVDTPTILNIITPGELSGDIISRYFSTTPY